MDFLLLILFFMVIILIMTSLWYLLPYLLIFWAVMAVINYFRTRKYRKQVQQTMEDFYNQNFQQDHIDHSYSSFTQSNPGSQANKRAPKAESIDVEYVEYEEEPELLEENYDDDDKKTADH